MASQTLKLPAQVGLCGKLCVKRSLKLGYMNHRELTARYTFLRDITHVTDRFKVVARGTFNVHGDVVLNVHGHFYSTLL